MLCRQLSEIIIMTSTGLKIKIISESTKRTYLIIKSKRYDLSLKHLDSMLVSHWNRMPREVVDLPSLEMSKRHVDEVLRIMV